MKGEITPAVSKSSKVDLVPGGCSCQTAPEIGSAASLDEGCWAAPTSHSVPWEGHTAGSSARWGCTEREALGVSSGLYQMRSHGIALQPLLIWEPGMASAALRAVHESWCY